MWLHFFLIRVWKNICKSFDERSSFIHTAKIWFSSFYEVEKSFERKACISTKFYRLVQSSLYFYFKNKILDITALCTGFYNCMIKWPSYLHILIAVLISFFQLFLIVSTCLPPSVSVLSNMCFSSYFDVQIE